MASTQTQDADQVVETPEETEEKVPRNPLGKKATEFAAETGRKLGSRVTARQVEAVQLALEELDVTPLKATSATKAQLTAYGQTGERDSLPEKAFGELRDFVKSAQGQDVLTNDSQRRRLWPRKVANILVILSES